MPPIDLAELFRQTEEAIAAYQARLRKVPPTYQPGDRFEFCGERYVLSHYQREGEPAGVGATHFARSPPPSSRAGRVRGLSSRPPAGLAVRHRLGVRVPAEHPESHPPSAFALQSPHGTP